MSVLECPREHETVAAVLSGRWPDGCDQALCEHAASCRVCREVTLLAGLLREDHTAGLADARVPAAGQVWWRAAVRARVEAAQTASRPLTWMQGVAGAALAGLAIALFSVLWPLVRAGVTVLLASSAPGPEMASPFAAAVQQALPLLLAAGAFVIVTPIALYFALSEKGSEGAK